MEKEVHLKMLWNNIVHALKAALQFMIRGKEYIEKLERNYQWEHRKQDIFTHGIINEERRAEEEQTVSNTQKRHTISN